MNINATDLIQRAGGARAMAELLEGDLTSQAVYAWERNGVPRGRVYELMLKKPEWFNVNGSLKQLPLKTKA